MLDQATIAAVAASSYTATHKLLTEAAAEMSEAAKAAARENTNLAIGTAMGAETSITKAMALLEAVRAIRNN